MARWSEDHITGKQVCLISEHLARKTPKTTIAKLAGVSTRTVYRVAEGLGYTTRKAEEKPKEPGNEKNHSGGAKLKETFLKENWHWQVPEKQPDLTVTVKKKRKPTNFRTPYSYPRLWDMERRENE